MISQNCLSEWLARETLGACSPAHLPKQERQQQQQWMARCFRPLQVGMARVSGLLVSQLLPACLPDPGEEGGTHRASGRSAGRVYGLRWRLGERHHYVDGRMAMCHAVTAALNLNLDFTLLDPNARDVEAEMACRVVA